MKLTWMLLMLAALCAHEATAQVTKKTTTPKPIPCNKEKFKETMTNCCGTQFGIMASDEYLDSCICGKKDPEVIEWLSYYKMNLLMGSDNKTDLNSATNTEIKFQGLFYGAEASDAIVKSNPNREGFYAVLVTDYLKESDSYYHDGTIPPKWNETIDCVTGTGATKPSKAVYLGNLFLTQYFVTNVYYHCENRKTDAVCLYKWNRWGNCDADFQDGAWMGQTAKMPQWLSETVAKNQKKFSAFMAKYKQEL